MFPFGRLGAPKTGSRSVAPPPQWVESSPELVLKEEEEEAVVVRRDRKRKSLFLGVFPPKKGECRCGKSEVSWSADGAQRPKLQLMTNAGYGRL